MNKLLSVAVREKNPNKAKTTCAEPPPSVEMKNIWYIRYTLIWIVSLTKERMLVYTLGRVGRGREGNVCERTGRREMWPVGEACVCLWVYEEAHCCRGGEWQTGALKCLALQESHENPWELTHVAHVLLGSLSAHRGNWPALPPHTKHFGVKAELLILKYRTEIF